MGVFSLLLSCSQIDADERLIYVKPAAVNRQVLVEDFTGQRCVNCPKATEEIARLQEQYGEDVVIAVAIHSGPLAFQTNSRFLGLKTDVGDEYYDYWKVEYQPSGMIDRSGIQDYTSWAAKIREELQKPASVSIVLNVMVSEDRTLSIQTDVMGVDGDTNGKLQLWLTEDNITAFQLMPDGTRRDDYLHQHVFRAAVNGTWGEALSVKEGETVTKWHTMALDDDWKKESLHVVAFVYDDSGVRQVVRKTIDNG